MGASKPQAARVVGTWSQHAPAIEIETALQPFAQERIVFSPAETTLDAPTLKTQAGIEQTATPEFTRKNLARKENILNSISNFISAKFTGNAIDDAPLMVFDAAKNKYTLTVGRINAGEKDADLFFLDTSVSYELSIDATSILKHDTNYNSDAPTIIHLRAYS